MLFTFEIFIKDFVVGWDVGCFIEEFQFILTGCVRQRGTFEVE